MDPDRFEELCPELRLVTGPDKEPLHINEAGARLLGFERPEQVELSEALASALARSERVGVAEHVTSGGRRLRVMLLEVDDQERRWWRGVPLEDGAMLYAEALEHTGDTILIHDMQGRLVDVNQASCDELGYTRDELLEMHVPDVEMTVAPGSLSGIWNRMVPGQPVRVEGEHRRADGTTTPVGVSLTLIEVGQQLLMLARCRDITRQRHAEAHLRALNEQLRQAHAQARAASEAKSTFLANVSHDLRTPLNAIVGYSELVREELEAQGDHQEHIADLGKVMLAARHLVELINDLLDLTRIEAGRAEVEPEAFALAELFAEIEATCAPLASSQGNTLRFEGAAEAGELYTDQRKLKQVLFNLVSNAAKFTEDGLVRVRARAAARSGALLVEVEDTGCGIAPEQLEDLFEPFARARPQDGRERQGTGLGLAICRRLAQLLGGDMSAESTPGVGSIFRVEVPRRVDRSGQEEGETSSADPLALDAPLELIVSGSERTRRLLEERVRSMGHRPVCAEDARAGLAQARAISPASLLLDLELPRRGALEMLRELRHDPTLRALPIEPLMLRAQRGWLIEADDVFPLPPSQPCLEVMLRRHGGALAPPQGPLALLSARQPEPLEALGRMLERLGWRALHIPASPEALAGELELESEKSRPVLFYHWSLQDAESMRDWPPVLEATRGRCAAILATPILSREAFEQPLQRAFPARSAPLEEFWARARARLDRGQPS